MARCSFRDSTAIGDFERPYIVAEVNSSHNGDIDTAKRMVDAAREAGCACVKFQSWSADSLYSKTFYDGNPIARRLVQKFAFNEAQLRQVAQYCRHQKIAFASTPYSKQEVDFLLQECSVPYIKVASMELNNIPFLDYIARTGAPMVLSTGMGEMDEIKKAVAAIRAAGGKDLCLLHCVSLYPAEASTIRLNNILGLRQEFSNCPIGFSDHTLGTEMASAAVALGAALVEKHLTLDRSKIGMDNQMASEPAEMSRMVRECLNVHGALGGTQRIVPEAEREQRRKMRRSLIASRDLKAGTRITGADLDAKRPGTGLPPDKADELIGKILLRDVERDTLIAETDFAS